MIKEVEKKDIKYIAPMVKELWSEHEISILENILLDYIENENSTIFAYLNEGKYLGVALCYLRSDYVEGCSYSPVGYLEGIYVMKEYRNKGIAKSLIEKCKEWSKNNKCKEFASDCELNNIISYDFHMSVGFSEANRIIHFKMDL